MRRIRRALGGLLVVPLVALTFVSPAASEEPPSPLLAPRQNDEAGRRRAEAELRQAQAALRSAQTVAARAAATLPAASGRLEQAQADVAAHTAEEQLAARQLGEARARLRDFAVARYLSGGSVPSITSLLESKDRVDLARRGTLLATATDKQREVAAAYETARAQASARLEDDVRAVEAAVADQERARSEADAAAARAEVLGQEVENRRLLLDLVTAAAPVQPSDIPRLFLDAYRRGATAMQSRAPGCRVGWTAVAAIGKIETNHGRYRASQLALNGDIVPRILGLPLDGTNNTRKIPDSDQGALDGDIDNDRAVGPMQFIPSTWKRMTQDGNGDGVADPNNAYDSALATAAYLCRATGGGPVDVEEGQRTAFFSYNHSDAYVENALAWMRAYDAVAGQLPPPPPPPIKPKRASRR